MTSSQLRFPIFVGTGISPTENALQLLVGPGVEVDGFHSGDMGAHSTVDARTANADKDAQVPACPSRICKGKGTGQYRNTNDDGMNLTQC